MNVDVYRALETRDEPPSRTYRYSFAPIEAGPVEAGRRRVGAVEASGDEPVGQLRLPEGAKLERDRGETKVLLRMGGAHAPYHAMDAAQAVKAAADRGGNSGITFASGFDEESGGDQLPGPQQAPKVEPPAPLTITYSPGDRPELLPPGTTDEERETYGTNVAALARAFIRRRHPLAKADVSYRPGETGSARKGAKVDVKDKKALGDGSEDDLLDELDEFVQKHAKARQLRDNDFDADRFVAAAVPAPSGPASARTGYRERGPGSTPAENRAQYRLHEAEDAPDERVKYVAVDDAGKVRAMLDEQGEDVPNVSTRSEDYELGKVVGTYHPDRPDELEGLVGKAAGPKQAQAPKGKGGKQGDPAEK